MDLSVAIRWRERLARSANIQYTSGRHGKYVQALEHDEVTRSDLSAAV